MKKNTWNLKPLYKSDTDPKIKADKKRLKQEADRLAKKWAHNPKYLSDPKVLLSALRDLDKWLAQFGPTGNIAYYFSLRQAQEMNNPKVKAGLNQIEILANEINDQLRFFTHQLAKIPKTKQKQFLKDASLAPYHYFLKRLFIEARYLRSEAEEKILSRKAKPAREDWVNLNANLLVKSQKKVLTPSGRKAPKSFSEILTLISHQKPEVRHSAASAFNEILAEQIEVAEAEINAILYNKMIDDQLRGFDSPEAERLIGDDISPEVIDTLMATVKENYHLAKKFYRLKSRLLKQDKLKYHERNVSVGEVQKDIPWSEAKRIVSQTFHNLDPELGQLFDNLEKNGQIDIYPKTNKASGAFCAHNSITSPTYILLNYTNEIRDVTTLAHEAGHGIHNELMRRKVKPMYFETSLATAEVASTFFEDFTLKTLAQDLDEKAKLNLKMEKLNDDISTIFRQVAAYHFERELHQTFRKEGYLASQKIGQIFTKHMKSYMGPAVEQSPGSANWWIYWSHFRRFFYVYSYASGALIAKALQAKVKANPEAIKVVKDCLSLGASDSPENIFKQAGIDLSQKELWQTGLAEIEKEIKEIEKLIKA